MSANPAAMELPDRETWLLPQRAYSLSMRDQALPARRAAIEDSMAAFLAADGDEHMTQLKLLQLVGDCLQPVEDVGVMAVAITSGLPGLPFYVRATVYDMKAVNAFFDELAEQDDDYFLRLAALRFDGTDIYSLFDFRPPLQSEDVQAISAAYAATAKLLREHLTFLAKAFRNLYGYFMAFKHGALVMNPRDVKMMRDRQEVVARMGVWARRTKGLEAGGYHAMEHKDFATQVRGVGGLALDMLDYLIDTRLEIFDFLQFEDDGRVTTRQLNAIPWQFWMRSGDVGQENITRLRDRLHVDLLDVPAEPSLPEL